MKLSAHDLHFHAGNVDIVSGVSLDVGSGEFLGIIGPNGSGKSTLLSMLAGIRKPRRGHVTLGEYALSRPALRLVGRRRRHR